MLVIGLLALAAGALFWVAGPDLMVLTVVFGGSGLLLVLGSLGRVMGWER